MRRVTVADVMRETGLSRATVDRALNRRGSVHHRTKLIVEDALRRLMSPEAPPEPTLAADIALRVGRGMMAQFRETWGREKVEGHFEDMHLATEDQVLRRIEALCRDISRPLIVTAKNSDRLTAILRNAKARGKRIIAVVSDLAPDARDAFIGVDDRAAGQTAAFLIGRALGDRRTTVGVVVGSTAFLCHEDREIGFRAGLRAQFPKVVLSAEAQGEDSSDLTKEAVLRMLKAHPAIGAIYNVGGGNAGLVAALRQTERSNDVMVVAHEVNTVTTPLLREGGIDFVIAGDNDALLRQALRLCRRDTSELSRERVLHDFGIYTKFNLPGFAVPS